MNYSDSDFQREFMEMKREMQALKQQLNTNQKENQDLQKKVSEYAEKNENLIQSVSQLEKKSFGVITPFKGSSLSRKIVMFTVQPAAICVKTMIFLAKHPAVLSKLTAKLGSDFVAKKIPIIGGVISLVSAFTRFSHGEWIQGCVDLASGALSTFLPGIGTGIARGLDLGNAAWDIWGKDRDALTPARVSLGIHEIPWEKLEPEILEKQYKKIRKNIASDHHLSEVNKKHGDELCKQLNNHYEYIKKQKGWK